MNTKNNKIDGKLVAEDILLRLQGVPVPKKFLGVILIGEDLASINFIEKKKEIAERMGIDFRIYNLSKELKNDEVRKKIGQISGHSKCGGVIVQLPLPQHIDKRYVLNAIPPEKDVDVLGHRALGNFYAGGEMLPPAVSVVSEIFTLYGLDIKEISVAVLGAGYLTGKPVASWLTGQAKEVFVLDKGSDLEPISRVNAVVSGVGHSKLFSAKQLKEGAGVIDFGISFDGKKMLGDMDEEGSEKLLFYTSTPGGTGPILVAKVFENFYKLNQAK